MVIKGETTIVVIEVSPSIRPRPVLEPVDIPRQEHSPFTYFYHHLFISVEIEFYDNEIPSEFRAPKIHRIFEAT